MHHRETKRCKNDVFAVTFHLWNTSKLINSISEFSLDHANRATSTFNQITWLQADHRCKLNFARVLSSAYFNDPPDGACLLIFLNRSVHSTRACMHDAQCTMHAVIVRLPISCTRYVFSDNLCRLKYAAGGSCKIARRKMAQNSKWIQTDDARI